MKDGRAADTFLDAQDWAFEIAPENLQRLDTRIGGNTEPRLVIDVPGGPYDLTCRTFNLLTVAAHDYTKLLRFFSNHWPDDWQSFGPTSLPIDHWRNTAIEEATGHSPCLTREGMNYLAAFWRKREQPYHNHAPRYYVRPHIEAIRHNYDLFFNLEIGPVSPCGQVIYRGMGDPIRIAPE